MTERFARERVRHELVRRQLTVLRTSTPAPGFVRVVLGGADLAGFTSLGPADHVKLFFEVGGDKPAGRDYTPLSYREDGPHGPELEIDFFLHGAPNHTTGPAAAWAATAAPGSTLQLGGPRGSALPPRDADTLVLIADETALPAVSLWLKALPDLPVVGLFSVEDPAVAEYLADATGEHRTFHWFTGAQGEVDREAALRALPLDEGTFYFLAGESKALIPLRRFLRRELELPKAQVSASGYWKRGTAGHDHHAPVDPSDSDD